MTKGLTNLQCLLCSFLVLALNVAGSMQVAPYAIAFASEVRNGFNVDILGYTIYVQEETLLVRASMYYGWYTLFFAGTFSVCLWHLRWWTAAITAAIGILVVSGAVFANELSYAINTGRAVPYPDSMYWVLGFYHVIPIGVCLQIYGELGNEKLTSSKQASVASS